MDVPYGFIKGNDLYLSAWGDHKDRKIGEVKEDGPEAAVSYFQEKFKDFSGKIQGLVDTIEGAENKGSYLMKLLHLKEQLAVHEGLGDYADLGKTIEKYEALLSDIIGKNRERNTEIKNALMIEAKEAVEIVNWQESTEKLQDVKARWLKTGNAKDDVQDQLEEDFWGIIEDYFGRKKAFYEDKKRLTDLRKEKYESILKEADGLSNLRGKDRFDKVKELKAAWEAVGNIPAKEYKPLQFRFNGVLKGRRELPPPDFSSMKEELDKMFGKQISVDKDMLQRYRKSLGSFKTREPHLKEKRHETMQLINVIWERDFLEGLAGKKHKGFDVKTDEEQARIMVKLLKEFLRRDLEDLKQYEENSEKFAGHDQNTNRMLERKLGQQRNKITVKEKLLEILEEKAG
ncbi:MAG: DUF349 domain-containing protein [Cyclobacteriaceae bacterium]